VVDTREHNDDCSVRGEQKPGGKTRTNAIIGRGDSTAHPVSLARKRGLRPTETGAVEKGKSTCSQKKTNGPCTDGRKAVEGEEAEED